jgi:ABC-type protease/lipase transport system fused ATPase/permease subunit
MADAGAGAAMVAITPSPPAVEQSALSIAPHVTFTDIAVISVTSVGVIVAAMAVVLGVLAIFGWRAIKDAASEAARRSINRYLQSDDFRANVKQVIASEVADQLRSTLRVTVEHAMGPPHGDAGTKEPFKG